MKRKTKRTVKRRKQWLRFPAEDMSPAFRPYTRPVGSTKRGVYVFAEVAREGPYPLDFLGRNKSGIIAVRIGRYTRKQLKKLSRAAILEEVKLSLPGRHIFDVVGFGHELTRKERKGKLFSRAAKGSRRARRSGAKGRNKPTKKKSKIRRPRHRA